jgi:hypothetical protein
MWTKEHRERQKVFERRRYPTDLTDEEWERIRPYCCPLKSGHGFLGLSGRDELTG